MQRRLALVVAMLSMACGDAGYRENAQSPPPKRAGSPTSSDAGAAPREEDAAIPRAVKDAGSPSAPKDAPPSSGYTYEGCPVFGPNGWFDTNVSTAEVDPSSARYIQATVDAGDTGGFGVWIPPNERINLATSATPLSTVKPVVSWHTFPFEVPWAGGFYIEPASDGHSLVVQRDSCHLYELYNTTDSDGTLSAYSGAGWDMTKPFDPDDFRGATASGLPLVAMMVKPEELAAGVIPHVLGWDAIGEGGKSTVGDDYVAPANSSGGLTYTGPSADLPMPYGSHIRLKSAFDDSGYAAGAKAVTTALKQYGAYLYDTGCCDNIPFTDDASGTASSYWTSADGAQIAGLHITDFDVIIPTAK